MRILHVTPSTNPADGGVAEAVRQMCEALQALGHHCEVASPEETTQAERGYPVPLHALGPSKTSYLYSPHLPAFVRANASRFETVISHGMWQHPGWAVRTGLRGSSIPYFVYPHGMLDPWFKRTYPLKHLKKWLYWPWADYRVLRDARAALFTCEEERRLARESFWLYRCRERVAPLGLSDPGLERGEAQRGAFFARHPELRGKRLLLFLGRLHIKKGCDLLLDAFAQVASEVANAHLVMAGPDQTGWRAELEARAASLGVAERVSWPGLLMGDLKWGALRAADAFVLPSHQENFGLAVVESLACGTPVLLSDQVNIWREIITDGAGLAAPDTFDGTVHLLRTWLAESAWSSRRLGARTCFARRFESIATARHLIDVLSEIGSAA